MRQDTRLDLRLNASDKERIARAAALRGVSVSTFVRSVALNEAGRVVAEEDMVTLSAEEGRRFLAALDKPFTPNARLGRALAQVRDGD